MRHLPFGLIVLACLLMLSRPLLSPDLVLLPADLLQHALPFVGEPDPEVQNRRVSDVIEQFYPYYSFVRGEFRKGRLPLWNPYVLSGTPFLATAVSAVLSPLNLLLLPISLESSYEWGALLKLIVAAAGVFLFLRRIGLSSWAAAIGGAAYSFSGYQIFFLLYPNTAVSMCMGWGLWAVEGLLQGPSRRGVAVVGVIVGVSILGGQPECSLLAVMAWTLYGLSRNWRRIGAVLGSSLLGVMMAALVLLPFVELVVGGGTLELRSLEGRNPWHIGLWELPALLYPYFLGSPSSESGSRDVFYGLIFVGLIPLLLAFGSFFSWRHRQVVRSLWAVAGAAFVILFGVFPFFDLFTSLPLLESANHLHSILVLQVSLAALAGIGADLFSSKKGSVVPRRLGLGVGALTGLVGLALFVQPAWNPDAVSGSYTLGPWRSSYPLYPLLVLGALPGLYVLKRQAFSFAVLVLILVNGVLFGVSFNPVVSRTALESTNSIVEQLGPHTHERIAATGVATLLPNYGMSLGLRDVRGYESLVVKRVPGFYRLLTGQEADAHHFIPSLDEQGVRLLRTMGVSRVLSPDRFELEGLTLLRSKFPYIYGVEGGTRVEFSREVTVVRDGPSALRHVLGRQRTRDTVVEAPSRDHLTLPGAGDRGFALERDRVEWISDLPDLVVFKTTTSAPALLILRDTYYRGWRAVVDGAEVPILRTDYLFRGVEVPAGEHTVRFEFRPLSFRIGLVISVLAWLAGIGLFVVKRID